MRWFFLLLLMPLLVFSQLKVEVVNTIAPEFLTISLDSTDADTIYYLFPSPAGPTSGKRYSPSETAPTSASAQAQLLEYAASGVLTITIVTDTVTAEESDSLTAWITPYFYDKTKETFYQPTDTVFLDFNTNGTYVQTSKTYLNWTHGEGYIAYLTGSDIWPVNGFVLEFSQLANGTADADMNIYVGFYWQP